MASGAKQRAKGGTNMDYVKPAITDLGSITDHTFGNHDKGNGGTVTLLSFDEPSHS